MWSSGQRSESLIRHQGQTEHTGQDPGKELRAGPGLLLQLCEDKPGAQGSGSSLVALGGHCHAETLQALLE